MTSLQKDYSFKLATNVAGLLTSALTMPLIPRGLGARAYGDYAFLTSFFSQCLVFLDMGTSTAFYTKLSQRPHDSGLLRFYLRLATTVCCIFCVAILALSVTPARESVWPQQRALFVNCAALYAALTWIVQILNKTVDAFGMTVVGELTRLTQKCIALCAIVVLYYWGQLGLLNYFLYQYFVLCLLGVAFGVLIRRKLGAALSQQCASGRTLGAYGPELFAYSHPLFTSSVIALIVGVLDRWLLQVFGGSKEQAFFGLSYQVASMCFLFTGAMTPLIMREFAVAHADGNKERMTYLFRRYVPLFYGVSTFVACFLATHAGLVARAFGGEDFQGSALSLGILALYPLHQTYGQLSGSVFYASGQTREYRNINVMCSMLGLPLSYFLLAPANLMGVNGGAAGLATKVFVIQLVSVNAQLYVNSCLLGLRMSRYVAHQVLCVASFMFIAVASASVIDYLVAPESVVVMLALNGTAYALLGGVLVICVPATLGLSRSTMRRALRLRRA